MSGDYWYDDNTISDDIWSCGICHKKSSKINVISYPFGNFHNLGEMKQVEINLKYCGDNIICAFGALEKAIKGEL